jgi:hypothetical protein
MIKTIQSEARVPASFGSDQLYLNRLGQTIEQRSGLGP